MNYHNITKDDMLNGDGLRVVLWVSGCKQNCKDCQNPQTHDFKSGILFDQQAEDELFEACKPDYISGLTLSGGHPLEFENIFECERICKKFKELFPHKTIWVYTGYIFEALTHYSILKYVDVLVDGRFITQLKDNNAHWVGSTNQRVIDVQKSLIEGKVVLHES